MFEVELVPQVARKWNKDFGWVEVKHNQYDVYVIATVSGRKIHCGYVGMQPNAPFNTLPEFVELPEEVKQAVSRQVDEKLGGIHEVFEPAMIHANEESAAEEEEVDDGYYA